MTNYPHIAARMFNVPLMIHPTKGQIIAQAVSARLGIGRIEMAGHAPAVIRPAAMEDDDFSDFSAEDDGAGYEVINGVAVIPVTGTLVHKGSSVRPYSGMLGYNAIAHNYLTALADSNVRGLAFECNSPGGEVSGCFDLVDLIHAHRGNKPTWAILDDMAYSACYAIASACDHITVPRTGGSGSVGVITMHADFSRALDADGITVTIFRHGDRKADGNPYESLSKDAKAGIQADIDALGDLFVTTVARNRNLTPAQVRKTQAATYMGAAGVDAGFVDAVMAPDEAFRSLLAELG